MAVRFETAPWADGLEITLCAGHGEALSIPADIGGRPVRRLGARLFSDAAPPERLLLPETLREIDPLALEACFPLRDIRLPEGLEALDGECLAETGIEHLHLPDSLRVLTHPTALLCTITVSANHPAFFSDDEGLYQRQEAGLRLVHLHLREDHRIYAIPEGCRSLFPGVLRAAELAQLHLPASLSTLPEGELSALHPGQTLQLTLPAGHPTLTLHDGCVYQQSGGETVLLAALRDMQRLDVLPGTALIGSEAFAFRRIAELHFPESLQALHTDALTDCDTRLIHFARTGLTLRLPPERLLRQRLLRGLDGNTCRYDFSILDAALRDEYMNVERLRLLVWRLGFSDAPSVLSSRLFQELPALLPTLTAQGDVSLLRDALSLNLFSAAQLDQLYTLLRTDSHPTAAQEMLMLLATKKRRLTVSAPDRFAL